MALEDEAKRALIEARRGPLENEKYSAELDLKLAKKSKDDALAVGPQERLDEIEEKLKLLAEEEAPLS